MGMLAPSMMCAQIDKLDETPGPIAAGIRSGGGRALFCASSRAGFFRTGLVLRRISRAAAPRFSARMRESEAGAAHGGCTGDGGGHVPTR